MIESYLNRHELFLEQIIHERRIPATLLHSAVSYVLFSGGKRIRPLFVYLCGHILTININVLDIIAAAVELTHCYSLVHDDLPAMDNDDYRRGKLSCHKQYDEATAILVGDGLQPLAIDLLITGLEPLLSPSQIVQVIQALVNASGFSGMVSGQSLDLSELIKETISEEELQIIHQLKTGKLISACFSMVLAAQEHSEPQMNKALMDYASHIGLVFQIQDDYLDCYASNNYLGKNRCSDLVNKKITFATLYTRSQLEEKINYHYEQALAYLESLGINATSLIKLTQQLHQRSQLE